jgi:hypothetical protein
VLSARHGTGVAAYRVGTTIAVFGLNVNCRPTFSLLFCVFTVLEIKLWKKQEMICRVTR